MTSRAFLEPVEKAATLLGLHIHPSTKADLIAVLNRLACGFPQDVLSPLVALQRLTASSFGSIDELDILAKVWPDWSGNKRFTLGATTLTWRWSSKHSGRYATITCAFPTVLPLTFTVDRYTDMDDRANHFCDPDDDDCNCESEVEQTATYTVQDWNDETEARVAKWLSDAVIAPVESVV